MDVLIANYHAPEEANLDRAARTLHKLGVSLSNIRVQKEEFNAEMYFRLLTVAKFGDLARMTQFQAADEETRTGQLLTYPVLMAHDVAGYNEVLVGADQEQHLRYARKLLRKYNKEFEQSVEIPFCNIVVGRVKDLREPDKKMSKSSPHGCLFLDDTPDDIRRKLRKATADEVGLENLTFLYTQFVGPDVPTHNDVLKRDLAEKLIEEFGL